MRYLKILFCLLSGFTCLHTIQAQESDIFQECVIPATDEHGSINFGVTAPPSYESTTSSYPVIYYLHGMNRYYLGPRAQGIASFFKEQFTEEQVPECILVFIDGGEGYWMDHCDGSPLLETEIVHFLIPYLDKNYRTIQSKRLIMGYSMGGNGAAFLYTKHPELFAAAASLDGGIVSYEDYLYRTGGRPEVVRDKDYFLEYGSPYGWVKKNRNALTAKQDTSILLTAGFLVDANKQFLSLLEDEGIPAKYLEFGYDHEFGYVFDESQDELIQFIVKILGQPKR